MICRTLLILMVVMPAVGTASDLRPVRTWDEARAAHLLRRAGFGGTPEQIRHFAEIGAKAAVDSLIDYEKTPQTHSDYRPFDIPENHTIRQRLMLRPGLGDPDRQALGKRAKQTFRQMEQLQIMDLRAWWFQRMILTPRPLEEKMTLFWHGHFTSGFREVRDSLWMYRQNTFLRENALGNFRDLLVGISQDPAMLRYLDNASNHKDKPNENYARELLELFTIGPGHYTEKDIKEAARAFTGWTISGDHFVADPRKHDSGKKKFLGQEGDFDGSDIIDILLKRNPTSRHLATKLLEFFVRQDPPKSLVDALEQELRQNRFDIRETLRTLFMSEAFYDEETMFSLVKSPVELVVGTVRLLEVEPRDVHGLAQAADLMGQTLFQPPNVKGWDGGLKWINTATLFTRYSFAARLVDGTKGNPNQTMDFQNLRDAVATLQHDLHDNGGIQLPTRSITSSAQEAFDPMAVQPYSAALAPDGTPNPAAADVPEFGGSAEDIVDYWVQRLLQQPVEPEVRQDLMSILTAKRNKEASDPSRVTRLVLAILCTPEFQVY